ncbi:MAG: shikimate kinase [Planctomycetota bacterium]|jgi:shikimate kinase
MNTILFGYRGSGKTTVGKLLARRLDQPFVDTDALVVEWFDGMTIAEIWRTHGEPAFRMAECVVTERVLGADGRVIALGGGTLMQERAREVVQGADACRVYLRGRAETLLGHINADVNTGAHRPSLTDHDDQLAEVTAVLAERSATYEGVADVIVDIEGKTPEQIAQEILDHA